MDVLKYEERIEFIRRMHKAILEAIKYKDMDDADANNDADADMEENL